MFKQLLTIALSLAMLSAAEAAPKKKIPVEQCWFLAWEVPCDPQSAVTPNTKSTKSRSIPLAASGNKNIQTAKQYQGLHSRRNRQQIAQIISQPFARTIDPTQTPWCAAFANYVLHRNGFHGTQSLQARSFLSYGVSTRAPGPGDLVILGLNRQGAASHVGFYVETVVMNGVRYVAVLGGNQKKSVQVSYFPAHKVLGYRQPVTS
jgi:uncharacterized protein (TIGR02594 family)